MTPERALLAAGVLWLASWIIAALWSDPTAERPSAAQQSPCRIAAFAGGFLVVADSERLGPAGARLWDLGQAIDRALVAVAALGLAFTWWARLSLGRLWSSSVTWKADHRVVDTGPYAIVRHPIYTGLIAAAVATALVKGALPAVAGAALMTLGFWIKARLEERFLRERLGPGADESYRRSVPMLTPSGPKSR